MQGNGSSGQPPWWHPDLYARRRPNLLVRQACLRAIRDCFSGQGFVEGETLTGGTNTPTELATEAADPPCLVCGTPRSQAGSSCRNPLRGVLGCRYTLEGDPIEEAIHRSLAGHTTNEPEAEARPRPKRGWGKY